MDDPSRVARLLLESATTLATACSARAIIVSVDALPEVESVPPRTILVGRSPEDEKAIKRLADSAYGTILVPNVELDRMGQVKLAAIIALSNRLLDLGDAAIFLVGQYRSPDRRKLEPVLVAIFNQPGGRLTAQPLE